jgi:23S rRNA (adenine2503-C2)-methyltransferase
MSRYNLQEIIEACLEYMEQTRRRVTFEYCLVNGINDSGKDAVNLSKLLDGFHCHVNLIPYNAINIKGYSASPQHRIQKFREILEQSGLTVTQRLERGNDIGAACGQLRTGYLKSLEVED